MAKRLVLAMVLLACSMSQAPAGPALLFDAHNGAVIYAEDADQPWHPASLTKLMTAYLTFHALKDGVIKLDDKLVCSQAAFDTQPSKIGLKVGQEITVDLALRALIVKSANDMAVMLAERIGGSEAGFANLMNATARRLGMTRSHFVNPHGLPEPTQVTSARDMALLTRAIITEFPEHAGLFAMDSVVVGKQKLRSHNGLLKTYEGADGMKTGFICDSGYNVVASATRNNQRLVAVVLGEANAGQRNGRAAALLDYGFQHGFWKTLFGLTTIENMPPSVGGEAKVASIRNEVEAWACGWRKKKSGSATVAAKQQATTAAAATISGAAAAKTNTEKAGNK